ncbi:MerR family transcriptional regulator [Rhodoferax sp. GW822-FHT02A01]|uniref:MerR family transcriptional regulator n=1 Tax=Rhodoferax sp. GW822-FHT02A01 TaxID=3141537 RepID=UPI00315CB44C
MLLKVGELARRTGLTVRTLHHYDAIDLLRPSARSEADYRLYNQTDVARLHAIQALRHLGLSLADVKTMLKRDGEGLSDTIARQIRALGHEIEQANELRERLRLLQERLDAGAAPDMGDWLSTLALMNTYSKYFSAAEIKRILDNRKAQSAAWEPLIAEVRVAMRKGLGAEDPATQSLALRWMNLTLSMMDDNFSLIERWGQMVSTEPKAQFKHGPGPEVVAFITAAIGLRMAAMQRHLTQEELHTLRTVPDSAIRVLVLQAHALQDSHADLRSPQARAFVAQWEQVMLDLCAGNAVVLRKFMAAYYAEPILRAATVFDDTTIGVLQRALSAQNHAFAQPCAQSA